MRFAVARSGLEGDPLAGAWMDVLAVQAGEGRKPILGFMSADLARDGEPVESLDLELAQDPRRMVGGQRADQRPDPLA